MITVKRNLILSLAILVLFVVGCEKDEDDLISQAQQCLDNAAVPADANGCMALIDGIYSEKANRIRCALTVLENGTTQNEIIAAYEAMDTGSQDPLVELVTILGLGDIAPIGAPDGAVDAADEAIAENIKTICYQSDSVGLRTVSELILFGTRAQVAADLALADPEDSGGVAGAITGMTDLDAGEFGNDVFDLYCVPTYSNNDICMTLAAAGAGTADDATVGAALKACLNTDTCTP